MANRYWVGGTANWDGTAGTKWATTSGGTGGASVPTSADDVFLDANSGTGTVTIATGNTGCKSLTCTGFTGTLTGTATLNISGGFTLSSGMTCSATGQWTISSSGTLVSANKTLPPLIINGSGIVVDQGDDFTFTGVPAANVGCITLNFGTYNTNNYNITVNLTAGNGSGINVTGSTNPRTINLGSSTISVTFTAGISKEFWRNSNSNNLTLNSGTSTIICKNTSSTGSCSFAGGNLTFYNVSFESTAPVNITGANTFNNLTLVGRTSAGITQCLFAANQTINGTLTCSAGTNAAMRNWITSNTAGTARTLTCAAVSLTDVDFQDITIAGAASPASGTRLGDCKGNSGITFDSPKTVYWNLAGAQNWSAVGWATSSGGTPAANNFPLAQDTAIFDNTGSVTGTITVNAAWNVGTVDMSARTSAMTLAMSVVGLNMYGNWINGSGTALSSNRTVSFCGRNTQTITSSGKTFTFTININSIGGTVKLLDNFTTTSNSPTQLSNGTFDLNGYTFLGSTSVNFVVNASTNARNITFNGGTLDIPYSQVQAFQVSSSVGFTTTAGTGTGYINMSGSGNKSFIGGGSTFNCTLNQGGAGTLTIADANTFNDITSTYTATGATTITLPANATTTVNNFTASGTVGKLLTLQSSTAGTRATLSKASGTVSVSYVNIKDSNATGGALWQAYTINGNVNGGNNTGWDFGTIQAGNGLLFGSNF